MEDGDPEEIIEELDREEEREPPPMAFLPISQDVSHLVVLATPLEAEANKIGIFNVFDDGGYRTLLLCTMFGLRVLPGKQGDDAVDSEGRTFELKTVNLQSGSGLFKEKYPDIGTEHTLSESNLKRYRKTTGWIIGVFIGNTPIEVWQIDSIHLEPVFRVFDKKNSYESWHQQSEDPIQPGPTTREADLPDQPLT